LTQRALPAHVSVTASGTAAHSSPASNPATAPPSPIRRCRLWRLRFHWCTPRGPQRLRLHLTSLPRPALSRVVSSISSSFRWEFYVFRLEITQLPPSQFPELANKLTAGFHGMQWSSIQVKGRGLILYKAVIPHGPEAELALAALLAARTLSVGSWEIPVLPVVRGGVIQFSLHGAAVLGRGVVGCSSKGNRLPR
jgi:hypothetical protein